MALIERSMLVPFAAERMLALVNDVASYPEFLPWCAGSEVVQQDDGTQHAGLNIRYKGIKQRFSTRNQTEQPSADKPGSIKMTLLDGPFRLLDGQWLFQPLDSGSCKIEFRLRYEFSSKILEKTLGPAFGGIANSFVDAFVKRAESLYGNG
ncbi:MAG: type II toxin-antitoxin system RatA family toxin [Betaproteobacteria bacterium]|nr:MAG: type II toxin-antitoxin system RatA family toxin [Betaproteobacteria bacterium]